MLLYQSFDYNPQSLYLLSGGQCLPHDQILLTLLILLREFTFRLHLLPITDITMIRVSGSHINYSLGIFAVVSVMIGAMIGVPKLGLELYER